MTLYLKNVFNDAGNFTQFALRFFRELFKPAFQWREFGRQCYAIGFKTLPLITITGFIMGLVLTIQSRPTLLKFGAESWLPSMVSLSLIREIAPVVTALICAGKIASGIGAELGSMRVTEQIDAMEVSGTNPFKYLVVTRILATTLMLPILVFIGDGVALLGSFLVENLKGEVSLLLYFTQVFNHLEFFDLIPSTIKSFFFGFAIGLVGCFKGYYCKKGTAGVGLAANSAVVFSSMLLFIIDFIAVFVSNVFYDV